MTLDRPIRLLQSGRLVPEAATKYLPPQAGCRCSHSAGDGPAVCRDVRPEGGVGLPRARREVRRRYPAAGQAARRKAPRPAALTGFAAPGNGEAQNEESPECTGLSYKDWRRPTFPQINAVSSAMRGLTSLFGMGRGGHPLYSHQK